MSIHCFNKTEIFRFIRSSYSPSKSLLYLYPSNGIRKQSKAVRIDLCVKRGYIRRLLMGMIATDKEYLTVQSGCFRFGTYQWQKGGTLK